MKELTRGNNHFNDVRTSKPILVTNMHIAGLRADYGKKTRKRTFLLKEAQHEYFFFFFRPPQ